MIWISKTTDEHTAEDCEPIRQGTHFCIGVFAAKGDVKLHNQIEKEGAFILFAFRLNGCYDT